MAAFEVHRWENDRIVEHWDNLQALPTHPNPSGRTMTDGATVVADQDRTASNKALVERFTQDVLIDGDLDALAGFFSGSALIQHNPGMGDGVPELGQAIEAGTLRYTHLHKLIGEGNMVLTISEGTSVGGDGAPRPTSYYDLYRIADGAIAEHWDVVEVIAPRDQWRNSNGKF